MVKIAYFGAICKAHAIAQPIETIGQNDFALTAGGQPFKVDDEPYLVAIFEVDLASVRRGK